MGSCNNPFNLYASPMDDFRLLFVWYWRSTFTLASLTILCMTYIGSKSGMTVKCTCRVTVQSPGDRCHYDAEPCPWGASGDGPPSEGEAVNSHSVCRAFHAPSLALTLTLILISLAHFHFLTLALSLILFTFSHRHHLSNTNIISLNLPRPHHPYSLSLSPPHSLSTPSPATSCPASPP